MCILKYLLKNKVDIVSWKYLKISWIVKVLQSFNSGKRVVKKEWWKESGKSEREDIMSKQIDKIVMHHTSHVGEKFSGRYIINNNLTLPTNKIFEMEIQSHWETF